MQFIDYIKIHVASGHGGKGCVAFRREKYVPKGGPNGGDGGRGGHVIFRADSQLNTLLDLRYRHSYDAQRGFAGMGSNKHGKDGEDLIIPVPVGSEIKRLDTGELIADLTVHNQEFMVARGGRGGQGNSHFATATRQVPRFAQPGLPGEEFDLIVELKLLADVGLVGMPNAGKSTLIAAISKARPKIADYPFTTLVPNLGVVKPDVYRSFVVADIPGLIEGAHEGVGLGFQFLRHIERTRILLHMVDISVTSSEDSVKSFETINRELELYSELLTTKPMAVAATKTDIKGEGERLDALREYCKMKGLDFFAISSATREGVDELVKYLSAKVAQ